MAEVTAIGTLEYDLGHCPLEEFEPRFIKGRSNPFYIASLSLKMRIAPGFLRVHLCMNDRVIRSMEFSEPLLADLVTPELPKELPEQGIMTQDDMKECSSSESSLYQGV